MVISHVVQPILLPSVQAVNTVMHVRIADLVNIVIQVAIVEYAGQTYMKSQLLNQNLKQPQQSQNLLNKIQE